MKTFLVSYDLKKSRNYDGVIGAIKSFPKWVQISESFWAVEWSGSAADVYNHIKPHIDRDDILFVIRSSQEAAWSPNLPATQWLQTYLR